MNQAQAQLIVDALLSGRYRQGAFKLRPTKDTYCCLGVMCDLFADEVEGHWEEFAGDYRFVIEGQSVEEAQVASLPKTLCGLLELDGLGTPYRGKIFSGRGEKNNIEKLALANDTGYSFEEIAEMIRERYLQGENNA